MFRKENPCAKDLEFFEFLSHKCNQIEKMACVFWRKFVGVHEQKSCVHVHFWARILMHCKFVMYFWTQRNSFWLLDHSWKVHAAFQNQKFSIELKIVFSWIFVWTLSTFEARLRCAPLKVFEKLDLAAQNSESCFLEDLVTWCQKKKKKLNRKSNCFVFQKLKHVAFLPLSYFLRIKNSFLSKWSACSHFSMKGVVFEWLLINLETMFMPETEICRRP